MAVQGQSAFVSSGDAGAYDDSDELGTTNLDVDSPGNSPWVVSSGGTTLAGTIPLGPDPGIQIANERAWAWDYIWPLWNVFGYPDEATMAKTYPVGAGGGYSGLEPMPLWQRVLGANHYNAVQYFTPTAFVDTGVGLTVPTDWNFNATPSVQSGTANGRGEPDVSADADPETGYFEYYSYDDCASNGYNLDGTPATGAPCIEFGWGGTSFVAPQFNGSTAVIDSNLGHRVGFWSPQVYGFAASHSSPFTVLDSASTDNDNLFYTGTPHQLWNPATGLGIPDLSKLQSDFGH